MAFFLEGEKGMHSRSFYLYKRKDGTIYAEILDPKTGARVCYRSTGTKDKVDAAAKVGRWLESGIPGRIKQSRTVEATVGLASILKAIEKTTDLDKSGALKIAQALKKRGLLAVGISPTGHGNNNFIQFLYNFWDYDKSLYLRDRRAHGKNTTKRTCVDFKRIIKREWEPYFEDKSLSDITRESLREFGLVLRESGLASKTVNNCLQPGITALKWAYHEKWIPENVTEGLGGFQGGGKKRDILTKAEAAKLLDDDQYWKEGRKDRQESSEKVYAAALLAATSALRSGECRALRREDIGDKLVYIRHGFNIEDGLKSTKNGEERTIYLFVKVRALLLSLLEKNPHTDIEPAKQFVFWSAYPDKPISPKTILKYLHAAVDRAEIDLAGRKIDFHGLRHYVATKWADKTGDLRKVALVTGHKDLKQAARYSDHVDEETIIKMGKKAESILSFSKEKGA
jgi:integrase